MKNKKNLKYLAYFVFLPIIFSFWSCNKGDDEHTKKLHSAIKTETIYALLRELPDYRAFPGVTKGKNSITFSARYPGYVKEVLVNVGEKAKKGELILRMDPGDIENRIRALKAEKEGILSQKASLMADLEYAKANFKRIANLLKEGAATRDEFERVRARHLFLEGQIKSLEASSERLDASIREAQNQLSYLELISPGDGFVTERFVDPGTYVSPGASLLSLEIEKGVWFEAQVDEEMLLGLREGDSAYIEIPSFSKNFVDKVSSFVKKADPLTHTFTVRVDLMDRTIPGGIFGRMHLQKGTKHAILVPTSSVVDKRGISGVYIVGKDHIAHFRVVKKGRLWSFFDGMFLPFDGNITRGELLVEIISGISPGERIAISNLNMIREGSRVEY